MDFGQVPAHLLGEVDFSLPPEGAENGAVLASASRLTGAAHVARASAAKGDPAATSTAACPVPPRIYIGCAKWGRKEWIGKVYPKGTKEADFLEHYVRHYNSIELNATHYKIYSPAEIQRWADKAQGRPFLFCPKIPQSISHYSSLVGMEDRTAAFLEGVLAFKDQLGPIFLQLSDRYGPSRKTALFNYLKALPTDLSFFLEVRHPDWFSDPAERRELFHRLRDMNIGAVITDTAGRRDCAHMELTVPKTFVRYVGNSLHPTDYTRIDAWVERIGTWLDKGLEELYFFMHMHNEATSPELTVYLVDRLNEARGLGLQKPRFIGATEIAAKGTAGEKGRAQAPLFLTD